MANSVLLQAGAYAKFAQSKNASQTSNIYTMLNNLMQQSDEVTEENLKTLFDAWNKFIEEEYPNEKEKWQVNFDISNTTQSTKVNDDNTIDFGDWVDNSPEQESSNLVEEIDKLDSRIRTLENGIKG